MIYYFFALIILILIYFLIVSKIKYKRLKCDVNKIYIALKRLRYGDVNVRVENLNNKDLENIANRLFETIFDREMMIKEYQSYLADKNISLEEIIKQEKELRLFKEEFAATLTHDMKVPVIAELNSLDFLLEGRFGDLNSKQVEVLNLMKASDTELKELIENLLEVYKSDDKGIVLNKTDNSVKEFVENLTKEMKPNSLYTENCIVCDFPADDIQWSFDKFQMRRVLKNIIQNAITYSPNKTDIRVRVCVENSKLVFCVGNKGKGISVEDINMVFQKYYTTHSKFEKTGYGIGLYLAGKIIEAHKGEIKVISSDDNTEFIIKIPA